jgi:hypothetical protein
VSTNIPNFLPHFVVVAGFTTFEMIVVEVSGRSKGTDCVTDKIRGVTPSEPCGSDFCDGIANLFSMIASQIKAYAPDLLSECTLFSPPCY